MPSRRAVYGNSVATHVSTTRLDGDVHQSLALEATARNMTVNALLNDILRERYRRRSDLDAAIDELGGNTE